MDSEQILDEQIATDKGVRPVLSSTWKSKYFFIVKSYFWWGFTQGFWKKTKITISQIASLNYLEHMNDKWNSALQMAHLRLYLRKSGIFIITSSTLQSN